MAVIQKETVAYGGWPSCVRLANADIELVVTTDVGPRVIRCGFIGGQNMFHEFEDDAGATGGDVWRPYGGHRFWHAPEAKPRTFWPDNRPVAVSWQGETLVLTQPREESTGMIKQIAITLSADANEVTLTHRLTNEGLWDVTLAPWTLSVMAQGGRAVLPQEDFKAHAEDWLPARPLVLWRYTNMADPRWSWGEKYVQLRQDPTAESFQKVGAANSKGWVAYTLNGEVMIKRYAWDAAATYADMGCNTELFTNADMLEVESLGPLTTLRPGASVSHVERWTLAKAVIGGDESEIDGKLLPLVADTTPVT